MAVSIFSILYACVSMAAIMLASMRLISAPLVPSVALTCALVSLNRLATSLRSACISLTCFCTASICSPGVGVRFAPPESAGMSLGFSSMGTSPASPLAASRRHAFASSSFLRSALTCAFHPVLILFFFSSHRSPRFTALSPKRCIPRLECLSCSTNASKTLRASSGCASLTISWNPSPVHVAASTRRSYALMHSVAR